MHSKIPHVQQKVITINKEDPCLINLNLPLILSAEYWVGWMATFSFKYTTSAPSDSLAELRLLLPSRVKLAEPYDRWHKQKLVSILEISHRFQSIIQIPQHLMKWLQLSECEPIFFPFFWSNGNWNLSFFDNSGVLANILPPRLILGDQSHHTLLGGPN